ncbi:MAG: efflux RND transporter periplasmic adaptor subunit [Hydrogenophilales bacterium]|nr:efflux RND transporter periplasmic adaptor subunit [Hydrogenophilales bacterium]
MRPWLMIVMSLGIFTSSWAADVPGTLQWSQRVELSMPVSGVVRAVHADVGERVKKGQVLLTLDAAAYQAGVSESQAEWARHKEEELDAKRNLDRVQELYNRTVISTSELEQAQTRHVRAKAGVSESKARLTRSQAALGDVALRAPFDALVVARQVEPGQTVASQLQPQTLFVLARANEMIARAKVSLAQVEKMKAGDAVTVQVNQQSYSGKIKTLGLEPVGEKNDAGYWLDVLFAVKDTLRAGTPAVVKLP